MATPDSTISEARNPAAGAKPFALVSLDDFRAVNFQAVTATTDCAECAVLARIYSEAAHSAETAGDGQKARVFTILASVCGQHFKPDDPSGPFGPMWVVGGRRSAIPEDFKGAQAAAFQQLLPEIVHPGLRARVAEMIWLNDRKAHDAARVAIVVSPSLQRESIDRDESRLLERRHEAAKLPLK